jgi:anion-transporting  ArsA/GET3 family ATPase
MRAAGETDLDALAHWALDRARQAMLRVAKGPAAEAMQQVFAQQRALLLRIAQGIARCVAQEPAAEPWSARAGRALAQLEQRLRGLASATPEVAGWLERHRALLQQLSEAALERAQRGAKPEAARKGTNRLAGALEEAAWRHFDTDPEGARWAEQNGALLGKLDEPLG